MLKELFNLFLAFLYGALYFSSIWYLTVINNTNITDVNDVLGTTAMIVLIFGSVGLILFVAKFIYTIYNG